MFMILNLLSLGVENLKLAIYKKAIINNFMHQLSTNLNKWYNKNAKLYPWREKS